MRALACRGFLVLQLPFTRKKVQIINRVFKSLGAALILLHHLLPRSQNHVIATLLEQTLPFVFVLRPRTFARRNGRCLRGFTRRFGAEIVPRYQVLSISFRCCSSPCGGLRGWAICRGDCDLGLERWRWLKQFKSKHRSRARCWSSGYGREGMMTSWHRNTYSF